MPQFGRITNGLFGNTKNTITVETATRRRDQVRSEFRLPATLRPVCMLFWSLLYIHGTQQREYDDIRMI